MEEEIRAQLLANQAALQESATSWEDRVKEAQQSSEAPSGGVSEKERKVRDNEPTYLFTYQINTSINPMIFQIVHQLGKQ